MQTEKFLSPPRGHVSLAMREQKHGHSGGVFWFTGLSGAGKSTIAHTVEKHLFDKGMHIAVLDGDVIRTGLCSDLSFSPEGRAENIRRIAELSLILAKQGIICLCAFITPLKAHRDIARHIIQDKFHEIYISCSLEECEKRDVKGYYALARQGKIKNYTGISAQYDIPSDADCTIHTDTQTEEVCVKLVQDFIYSKIQCTCI